MNIIYTIYPNIMYFLEHSAQQNKPRPPFSRSKKLKNLIQFIEARYTC
jgi:hypothetical protein